MNWSMPQPVLQWVAGALAFVSLAAFTLGVVTAPGRGRLPGEQVRGQSGEAIQALDATPLTEERIEGPPPPKELTPEEKAKLEEEKAAREAAAALAKAAAPTTAPPVPTPSLQAPAADPVGDVLQKAPQPPPPEDPPF